MFSVDQISIPKIVPASQVILYVLEHLCPDIKDTEKIMTVANTKIAHLPENLRPGLVVPYQVYQERTQYLKGKRAFINVGRVIDLGSLGRACIIPQNYGTGTRNKKAKSQDNQPRAVPAQKAVPALANGHQNDSVKTEHFTADDIVAAGEFVRRFGKRSTELVAAVSRVLEQA